MTSAAPPPDRPAALLGLLGLLYALQAVTGVLVYFCLDLWWLSLPLGLAYLAGVWVVAREVAAGRPRRWRLPAALLLALLWQAPGLLGSLNLLGERLGWTQYGALSDLLDFVAQTFHTPLLPWVVLLSDKAWSHGYALYYWLQGWLSPALGLGFVAAALPGPRAAAVWDASGGTGVAG